MNTLMKINKFFDCKGIVSPIAEKAHWNFYQKTRNRDTEAQKRLIHYFSIGHSYKNIDAYPYWGYRLNGNKEKKIPTRFLHLRIENFDFVDKLNTTINDIRNINAHYIHTFDNININSIDEKVQSYIKEAFEFSCIHSYLNESRMDAESYFSDLKTNEQKLVQFLKNKFYPNAQYQENDRKTFDSYNKTEAIHELLFIDVEEDIKWKLDERYEILPISKGTYLSFYACLFLLSMFLYKNEANKLISQVKGFKRNDGDAYISKREIFTFFSKKYSSRDIDNEERHLVKFRDIIQYLNHYPTAWNKQLELKSQFPEMTQKLIHRLIELKIEHDYPEGITLKEVKERFILFTKHELFHYFYAKKALDDLYLNAEFNPEEIRNFKYLVIAKNEELRDLYQKQSNIKKAPPSSVHKIEKKLRDIESKIEREEIQSNSLLENLKQEYKSGRFLVTYGRNQDRFMDFASRYLAEINYFGRDARFRIYQFYTTDEQETHLIRQKDLLSKKEYDNLKYHQGRLVYFRTYAEHLSVYPEWDAPFVKENNAIQVLIHFSNGSEKILSVQRSLMIYLLEDALYNKENKTEGEGRDLVEKYYNTIYIKGFNEAFDVLRNVSSITKEQKTEFGKIMPKRLLHNYLPANRNNIQEKNPLLLILENAEKQEVRYKNLLEKAKKLNREKEFLKKNKGKQYKLRFIRTAWNRLFFKDIYLGHRQSEEHHKRFHITRDEYNNFCRWLFAAEEVPEYKIHLQRLFGAKGFFQNKTFQALFENGNSLDEWYNMSKSTYKQWLQTGTKEGNDDKKYTLESYAPFFNDSMLYINLSQFIKFLVVEGKLKRNNQGLILYSSAVNKQFLIPEYYYADRLKREEQERHGKLFNELRKSKLEDACLYELAFHYLSIDINTKHKTKANVSDILKQDLKFEITNKDKGLLYYLIIPFNKIEVYHELISLKEEQDSSYNSSFLSNITGYLSKLQSKTEEKQKSLSEEEEEESVYKAIKPIYEKFNKPDIILTYDDLNKIYSHIIDQSLWFTKINMLLEEYYITKENIPITKSKRIGIDNIHSLNSYYNHSFKKARHKAFHFGVPEDTYPNILKIIEDDFISKEIKSLDLTRKEDLPKAISKVTNTFLEVLYPNFYAYTNKDKVKRREDAKNRYFNTIIAPRKKFF